MRAPECARGVLIPARARVLLCAMRSTRPALCRTSALRRIQHSRHRPVDRFVAPALAREQKPRRPLARLLHSTRCRCARVPEERHGGAPGLLEKQEADAAHARDWFRRRAITPTLTRDVIGKATNQSSRRRLAARGRQGHAGRVHRTARKCLREAADEDVQHQRRLLPHPVRERGGQGEGLQALQGVPPRRRKRRVAEVLHGRDRPADPSRKRRGGSGGASPRRDHSSDCLSRAPVVCSRMRRHAAVLSLVSANLATTLRTRVAEISIPCLAQTVFSSS